MFIWYQNAEICYAYLSDVQLDNTDDLLEWSIDEFRNSKWFTRGWTLQELLSPKQVRFFSGGWAPLGLRSSLWFLVSEITGIEAESSFKTASIAQKMSWASRRETTRIEDRAYSLMGLFGVNMPPLYGEGEKAFLRLQLEILRVSDDESIFAWEDLEDNTGGLLARSPAAFRNSGDIRRLENALYEKPPYSMTNKGIRVEFPVLAASQIHVELLDADDTFFAFLQCRPSQSYSMFAILLRRIKGNLYTRVSSGGLITTQWNDIIQDLVDSEYRMVQVKQEDDSDISFAGIPQYRFSVSIDLLEFKGFRVASRWVIWGTSVRGDFDRSNIGEESFVIPRDTGSPGVTIAMEFTNSNSPEGEPEDSDESLAHDETDRFVMVFNMYDRRARLGLLRPLSGVPIKSIVKRLDKAGDWMTADTHIRASTRSLSGAQITAQLARKPTDLWLRSYQASFSFEYPVELPPGEIDHRVELPNNEVSSIERRNSMPGDPEVNYYVRGYLLGKDMNPRTGFVELV
ncbi:hypothetical protein ONS95_013591 [Cadophora gregata]|uniref:uncharacterized protein n=1 Tax=Cadophora gregata TaxID=51156 RepID=UPI0026DD10D2|nr:uncharacterized protein ONS95_013591 [Cadophora gregata]KAK0113335.1 hypothetical protein ONS96_014200 [Cadophora gregata f. sp. sojae]KAK0114086.1 hypothetical protein ONS95_013591 [Cadophora gregata]